METLKLASARDISHPPYMFCLSNVIASVPIYYRHLSTETVEGKASDIDRHTERRATRVVRAGLRIARKGVCGAAVEDVTAGEDCSELDGACEGIPWIEVRLCDGPGEGKWDGLGIGAR